MFCFSQGCSAPLVVKIADTPKDKERKKMQTQVQNQMNAFTNQWKNNMTSLAMLTPVRIVIYILCMVGWAFHISTHA